MEVFARSQRQAYTPIRTPFNVLAPNPSRSLCDIPKVGVKISLKKMHVVFFRRRSRIRGVRSDQGIGL
jgi:hypothetical protein